MSASSEFLSLCVNFQFVNKLFVEQDLVENGPEADAFFT